MNLQEELKKKIGLQFKPQAKSEKSVSLATIDVQPALNFKEHFYQNIQKPIQIVQEIQINKMPQKCFIHNLNFSLYCHEDRRPLCPDCVNKYNNKHKSHKVVPLSSSYKEISEDIRKYEDKVKKMMEYIEKNINEINDGIGNVDEECKKIQNVVKLQYKKLISKAKEQQNQILTELDYQKKKLRCERAVVSGNLKKSVIFVEGVLKKYNKNEGKFGSVTQRNVYEILLKTQHLLKNDLNEEKYKKSVSLDMNLLEKSVKDVQKNYKSIIKSLQILTKVNTKSKSPEKNKEALKEDKFQKEQKTPKFSHRKCNQESSLFIDTKPRLILRSPKRHNKSLVNVRQWR